MSLPLNCNSHTKAVYRGRKQQWGNGATACGNKKNPRQAQVQGNG